MRGLAVILTPLVVDEEGEALGGLFDLGMDCVEIDGFFVCLDEGVHN